MYFQTDSAVDVVYLGTASSDLAIVALDNRFLVCVDLTEAVLQSVAKLSPGKIQLSSDSWIKDVRDVHPRK